jgi:DNA-binding XRE family transcriptional regulator
LPRGIPLTEDEEAAIKAALEEKSHASLVARESKGAWSYATVSRVAFRAGIELTLGRQTMGRKRITAREWAAVMRARRADPRATQQEIAARTGVSRPSVSRIEGGVRRPRRAVPQAAE